MQTDAFLDKVQEVLSRAKSLGGKVMANYGTYLIMLAKALIAFEVFSAINGYFPGRSFFIRPIVVIAISLFCSVLPISYMSLMGSLWLLLQLSALSLEATAFMAVLLLVLALLRYLTLPGSGIVMVLLPLFFLWKIPFVIPLLVGLLGSLGAFVSVGSGVLIFYSLKLIAGNLTYLTEPEGASMVQRLLFLVKGFLDQETMLAVLMAFCLTTLLVYLLSRASVPYAAQISVVVGAIFNPLLLGAILRFFGRQDGPGSMIWGSLLGVVLGLIVSCFYRLLDHARTERVQFEDDEYYYYVKAVPKLGRLTKKAEKPEPAPAEEGQGRGRSRRVTAEIRQPEHSVEGEEKDA